MPKRKIKDTDIPQPVVETASKKAKPSSTTSGITKRAASKYTSQQERLIADFCQVTQADRTTAAKILKQNSWNTSAAVNAYFSSAHAAPNPARTKITQIFNGYREEPTELENEINFEGVGSLLEDLGIGLEDIGALVLFELVQSPQLGRIQREGFVEGFTDANADTTAKMRNVVLARRSKLPTDRTLFKSVYNHTFALLIENLKKAIDLEQAAEFWKLLFSHDGFEWSSESTPWLDWWLEFLSAKWNKAVNKDLWRQTLAFAEASKKDPSLSFWNEESSWPSVIDDFVEWVKTEKHIGGDAMEVE